MEFLPHFGSYHVHIFMRSLCVSSAFFSCLPVTCILSFCIVALDCLVALLDAYALDNELTPA